MSSERSESNDADLINSIPDELLVRCLVTIPRSTTARVCRKWLHTIGTNRASQWVPYLCMSSLSHGKYAASAMQFWLKSSGDLAAFWSGITPLVPEMDAHIDPHRLRVPDGDLSSLWEISGLARAYRGPNAGNRIEIEAPEGLSLLSQQFARALMQAFGLSWCGCPYADPSEPRKVFVLPCAEAALHQACELALCVTHMLLEHGGVANDQRGFEKAAECWLSPPAELRLDIAPLGKPQWGFRFLVYHFLPLLAERVWVLWDQTRNAPQFGAHGARRPLDDPDVPCAVSGLDVALAWSMEGVVGGGWIRQTDYHVANWLKPLAMCGREALFARLSSSQAHFALQICRSFPPAIHMHCSEATADYYKGYPLLLDRFQVFKPEPDDESWGGEADSDSDAAPRYASDDESEADSDDESWAGDGEETDEDDDEEEFELSGVGTGGLGVWESIAGRTAPRAGATAK